MSERRTGRRPPVPPPRLNGDYEADNRALQIWMKDVYQVLVTESGIGDPSYQLAASSIDEASPPDPQQTTIAQAQATANLALSLVKQLRESLNSAEARITDLEAQNVDQQTQLDSLDARVTALEP